MNRICRKSEAGFTLIELTTVVAILGILVALVTPMFQNYLIKTKVTELDSVAYGAKTTIEDYARFKEKLPDSEHDVDLNPLTQPKYLRAMSWNDGTLTIEANSDRLGLPDDQELSLVYEAMVDNGNIHWVCTAYGATRFAPRECGDGV
jgi:type IV pilus assembly protein PilA